MFNRGWGKKALGYQLIGYYLRKYPDKKIGIITKTKFAQVIKEFKEFNPDISQQELNRLHIGPTIGGINGQLD